MITNGYNLTPNIARLVLDLQIKHFQVTLDGPAGAHNRRRKHITGKGTFERIFDNLKAMREFPDEYTVYMRANFDRESTDQLPEFINLMAEEFGGDPRFSIYFKRIGAWGGPNDKELPLCKDKTIQETFQEMAVARRLRADLLQRNLLPRGAVCYAAKPYSFVVRADGRINKCTVALESDLNQVGQILPDGEMVLDQEKLSLWTTTDASKDEVCQKCFFRPVCHGAACPWQRLTSKVRPCPPNKINLDHQLNILYKQAQAIGPQLTEEVT
jgi:uncharacterized protein